MFNNKNFIFHICDIWFACLQTNIMRKTQNISNCLYQSLGILITHNIFASSRKIDYPRVVYFDQQKGTLHTVFWSIFSAFLGVLYIFSQKRKNTIEMVSTNMYFPQILKNKVDIQWLYNTWSLFHQLIRRHLQMLQS